MLDNLRAGEPKRCYTMRVWASGFYENGATYDAIGVHSASRLHGIRLSDVTRSSTGLTAYVPDKSVNHVGVVILLVTIGCVAPSEKLYSIRVKLAAEVLGVLFLRNMQKRETAVHSVSFAKGFKYFVQF